MLWEELPEVVDRQVLHAAEPAWEIKKRAWLIPTSLPARYYWHVEKDAAGVFCFDENDFSVCKQAAAHAVGPDHVCPSPLFCSDLEGGDWIKVAESPTLRRIGELFNFFPGKYPGGIPNWPNPVAAALTSMLVGGGLGYGAGWLGEKLMPSSWQKGKLRRTGAILGAGLGGVLPAVWAATQLHNDKSILSPWPFAERGAQPEPDLATLSPDAGRPAAPKEYAPWPPQPYMPGGANPLGERFRKSMDKFRQTLKIGADTFMTDFADRPDPTPLDVNIDAMGRTLWDTGASPGLTATTMGSLYAAQQLPDPNAREGVATGNQLGQLAWSAGKGYLTGALVGAALNKAIGMPSRGFGAAGAALAVIGSVVPRLFG